MTSVPGVGQWGPAVHPGCVQGSTTGPGTPTCTTLPGYTSSSCTVTLCRTAVWQRYPMPHCCLATLPALGTAGLPALGTAWSSRTRTAWSSWSSRTRTAWSPDAPRTAWSPDAPRTAWPLPAQERQPGLFPHRKDSLVHCPLLGQPGPLPATRTAWFLPAEQRNPGLLLPAEQRNPGLF